MAELTGKSRTFVSRIANGDTALGNSSFYRLAESKLPEMISARKKSFFALSGIAVEELELLK